MDRDDIQKAVLPDSKEFHDQLASIINYLVIMKNYLADFVSGKGYTTYQMTPIESKEVSEKKHEPYKPILTKTQIDSIVKEFTILLTNKDTDDYYRTFDLGDIIKFLLNIRAAIIHTEDAEILNRIIQEVESIYDYVLDRKFELIRLNE